ncbi:hypothetical protein QQ045_011778 [Rhodiola kirilowii]
MATTTTMEQISEALKLVDVKKESLRQAFLGIESSSLPFLSITWPDLDSHFSSIQSSLRSQFDVIKSGIVDKPIAIHMNSCAEQPKTSTRAPVREGSSAGNGTLSREVRAEMKALCENMDGRGLRKYIDDHHNELISIKEELSEALKFASDPALMVLDAMDDFYSVDAMKGKGDRDFVKDARRTCVVLLEKLMNVVSKKGVSGYVKEKAKNLAMEWKGKKGSYSLESLGFLTLVATYDLRSEFDADEIVEFLVEIAMFKEAINLCRMLIMPGKISDIVQKLIEAEKQFLAVKFICEFALAEKFPPVPLLKVYVNDIKQSAKNIRDKGNNSPRAMNEAATKETNALKTVIKFIEDHKLDSAYPPKILENRIEEIRRSKNNKKRPAANMGNEKIQQQHYMQPKGHQPSGSKRYRSTSIATPRTVPSQEESVRSSMRSYQPAHLHAAASSTVTPYMIPSSDVSGFSGSNPHLAQYLGNQNVAQYLGSQDVVPYSGCTVNSHESSPAGVNTTAGVAVVHNAKTSPQTANMYVAEPSLSAYYSSATAYGGGYNVPIQYHPQYYPQYYLE